MVGSAPLTNTLMKTHSSNTAQMSNVACQFSLTYVSGWFRLANCRTRSETKKHTDVSAAIQPMTVSQPKLIGKSSIAKVSGVQSTSDVAEEALVRSWCKQGHPMVLTSCCRYRTC